MRARRLGALAAAAYAGLAAAAGAGVAAKCAASHEPDAASLAVLVAARVAAAWLFRLERLPWGRLGVQDASVAVAAVGSGTVLAGLAAPAISLRLPLELLAADAALQLSAGLLVEGLRQLRRDVRAVRRADGRLRAIVYGAGDRGRALTRALLHEPRSQFMPVAFLDDDPDRTDSIADGLPVLGSIGALPYAAELVEAQAVICAVERPSERLEDLADQAAVRLVRAAGLAERLDWGGAPGAESPDALPDRETESAAV